MPRPGNSTEYVHRCEDEIARFLTASDHVERLRILGRLLLRRRMISEAYYHDMTDSLDFIAGALLVGKRNTARLRNGGQP